MRPLRFGVIAEHAQTPHQLIATARRAEAAGCSTLLIRDHLVEGPFLHQLAPLTALAAAPTASTRLRVGTSSSATTSAIPPSWPRSSPRWTCCRRVAWRSGSAPASWPETTTAAASASTHRATGSASTDWTDFRSRSSVPTPRQPATGRRGARARGWGVSAEQVLAMPAVLAGPLDRLVEPVQERQRTFGLTYLILSDASLDAAAPLIEGVATAAEP